MGRTLEGRQTLGRDERLEKLRRELGLDGIVVSSPTNTHFLSGCLILTQRLLPDRLALVVSTQAGETFVVCDIEERQARVESRISDIRAYSEFATSAIEVLASVLREFGAADGAIGFEGRHLVALSYEELRRLLPNAELVPIDQALLRLRAVKTRAEIQLLRSAFQATDRAIAAAFEAAAARDSTRSVADKMRATLLASGANEISFMIIGSGRLTVMGHPEPDDNRLRTGDAIRVDFGGAFRGYHTDLARSGFVKSANKRQRDAYSRLWGALEETISSVRPGIEARDVYACGKTAMMRSGLTLNEINGMWELPHIGHGIGLAIHEFPMLEPGEGHPLEPGMVLCVELIYTEPDSYRLHLEDAVVVTESGSEVLSRSRDWNEVPLLGRHD